MRPRNAYCSFCRKGPQDVGPLIEGSDNAYICGECVSLCQRILVQEKRRRDRTAGGPAATEAAGIRATLDRLLPGQESAKAVLTAAAGCGQEDNAHVLLIGPSQNSALLLARAVSFALEVPFVAADASGLDKAGDDNVFFQLLAASDYDLEAAQRGVMFLRGMEDPEAQATLCRLWQENVSQPLGRLTMAVGGVLFVCGATFVGLEEATIRLGRHPEQPITGEVLLAVGARTEWVAALSAIARVPPLDEESLSRILNWVDFRRA